MASRRGDVAKLECRDAPATFMHCFPLVQFASKFYSFHLICTCIHRTCHTQISSYKITYLNVNNAKNVRQTRVYPECFRHSSAVGRLGSVRFNRHIVWFILFRIDMSVRGDTSWLIYTPVFPIFQYNKKLFSSLHHCHFCAIVLQVEFIGVLRSVPLRRNEIRSILGDDCPLSSVQVEGPISS